MSENTRTKQMVVAIADLLERLVREGPLGLPEKSVGEFLDGPDGISHSVKLTEKEFRLLQFALFQTMRFHL